MLVLGGGGTVRAFDAPGPAADDGEMLAEGALWPTAHGSGDALAVVRLRRDAEGASADIEVLGAGRSPRPIPGSRRRTFIAPRLPIYGMWSPAGDYVSFVAADGTALGLYSWAPQQGDREATPLASGMPIFHAWHPRGSAVAVHAGEQLSLVKPDGSDRLVLARQVGGFRAPAWNSDGRLLAWAQAAGTTTRIRLHAGGESSEVAGFAGGVALAFRPDATELAVAVAGNPASGVFEALYLVTTESSSAPRRIARGPFAAFAWAPAGDRVALVVPAQTGDGRYVVEIRDADGAVAAVSEAFVPSQDTRTALGFFDQFSLSHPWWEPGGAGIVLCGRLAGDAVSSSFGDAEGPYAIWWPATRAAPLSLVAPAEFACFATPGPGLM